MSNIHFVIRDSEISNILKIWSLKGFVKITTPAKQNSVNILKKINFCWWILLYLFYYSAFAPQDALPQLTVAQHYKENCTEHFFFNFKI